MKDKELVTLVAEALFKQEWPFYEWLSQDFTTQYRYLDMAEKLMDSLALRDLEIVRILRLQNDNVPGA